MTDRELGQLLWDVYRQQLGMAPQLLLPSTFNPPLPASTLTAVIRSWHDVHTVREP